MVSSVAALIKCIEKYREVWFLSEAINVLCLEFKQACTV